MLKTAIRIIVTDRLHTDLGVARDFGPFHANPFDSMDVAVDIGGIHHFAETFARIPLPGGRRHVWTSCRRSVYSLFAACAQAKVVQSLLNAAWKDGEAEAKVVPCRIPWEDAGVHKGGAAPGPYTFYPVACRMEGGSPVRHVVVAKNSAAPGTPWVEAFTLCGGVWEADLRGDDCNLPARPAIKGAESYTDYIPQEVFRLLSDAYGGDPHAPDGRSVTFTPGTVKLALPRT